MLQTACPSPEKLDAYVLGRLGEAELEGIEEHLANCAACEQSVQKLDGLDQLFNAAFRQQVADEKPFLDEREFRDAVAVVERFGRSPDDTANRHAASTLGEPLEQLGEYRILERLGSGGMGTVYKAMHTRLQRLVALKMLPADRGQDAERAARFDREMIAVGALDDPHIVRVYDGREVEGRRILVMEYVEGLDLAELSRRLGPLPPAAACEIIGQAAAGLQAAHECGLVHRDIKPSNLMLSTRGEVKVLDLGLARFTGPADDDELTEMDQMLGTVDYMAPEQIVDSRRVDIRADIYGLGCTLYKLLTGHSPYGHLPTRHQRLEAHFHAQPQPLEEVCSDLPAGLASVVQRMMGKTAAERYATPREVVEALAPYREESSLAALIQSARAVSCAAVSSPTATPAGTVPIFVSAKMGLSPLPPQPAAKPAIASANKEPASPPASGSPRPEQPAAEPPGAASMPPHKGPAPPAPPLPAAPPEARRPSRKRTWLLAALATAAAVVLASLAWYAISHNNKVLQGRIIGYDPAGSTIVVAPVGGPATQGQQTPGQAGKSAAPLIFHIGSATRIEAVPAPATQASTQQISKKGIALRVGQMVEVTYAAEPIAGPQSQVQTTQASVGQGQQTQGAPSVAHLIYEAIAIRVLSPSPVKGGMIDTDRDGN